MYDIVKRVLKDLDNYDILSVCFGKFCKSIKFGGDCHCCSVLCRRSVSEQATMELSVVHHMAERERLNSQKRLAFKDSEIKELKTANGDLRCRVASLEKRLQVVMLCHGVMFWSRILPYRTYWSQFSFSSPCRVSWSVELSFSIS